MNDVKGLVDSRLRAGALFRTAVVIGLLAGAGFSAVSTAQARVGRASVTELQVAGKAGIPADAVAVAVNLAAVDPVDAGYLSAFPCGGATPTTSTVNHDLRHATSNSAIVKLGTGGKICIYSMSPSDMIVDVTGWFAAGSGYTSLDPVRLLDTRTTSHVVGGTTREVQITGRAGIPGNAAAVAVNLAAVDPGDAGYLSAFPCGGATPTTSTVNHDLRHATSNSAIVKLGAGGKICIYSMSTADIVVDVTGWFGTGSGYTSLDPVRFLDSRTTGRLAAGSTREVQITGRSGVTTNAAAVAVNLAAVDPGGAGYLSAFPCGGATPTTSTVNYDTTHATSNSAIVKVGTGGKICIYSMSATDIVVDVTGWFTGSGYTALDPNRLLDTRSTTPATTPPSTPPPSTAPSAGHFSTLPVGAVLPSGADCAARVRAAVEIRPENAAANANRGTRANANTRTDWSGWNRVDGAFSGTTDQIIQWAACKWGIDEDIVRAQVIKESYWYQSTNGDNGDSWGLGQVRASAHQSAFQYASVNARNSSAYNLDYTYASWRACFEGVYTWLNSTSERNGTYGPGDVWGCVGVWFSGRWYWNNDAYLNQSGDSVHWHYNNRTWTTSAFING
jgi:hypothetical protein